MQATDETEIESRADPLRDYRERTLDRMALIGYFFIIPFGLWHLYLRDYSVGTLMLILAATIAFRSYRRYEGHLDSQITWLLTVELLAAMFLGYAVVGVHAAFWSFPLSFVIIFLWPRNQSGPAVILTLSVLLPAAFYYFDQAVAIRLSITLILFCYMGYQLVGILIRMQDKLESQAMRDPLTGAYNRRYMAMTLQKSSEEVRRGFGPISIVAMDIDNFKSINDTFGHEAGDTVLKNLVDVLHAKRRQLDIVCRTGGEEFVVILRNTSESGASRFAERLRQAVEEAELLEGQLVTVSIGVAEQTMDESDDQWLNRADVRLYKAKNEGKNQVQPPPLTEPAAVSVA